jgi:1-acyl-sn-glycerol-3-phosphate acyltransferase
VKPIRAKSPIVQWALDRQPVPRGVDPETFDAGFVRGIVRRMEMLFSDEGKRRYFRVDARGWSNIPEAPTLIVSNHSGGTTIPDVWGLMFAWHRQFDYARPLHTLAHEIVFGTVATGRFFERGGVLRADPELGETVLTRHRRDLLVMPGGDVDVWRPYRERYKVKFAGRKGYARLALRAGAPIVPVANAGAHETLRVLTDGAAFARLIGLPKLARARIFPIHLSIPWGLAIGPWPHLPTPVRLRYRFGRVIEPPGGPCAPGEEPSEARVDELDRAVQAEMQRLLDGLAGER